MKRSIGCVVAAFVLPTGVFLYQLPALAVKPKAAQGAAAPRGADRRRKALAPPAIPLLFTRRPHPGVRLGLLLAAGTGERKRLASGLVPRGSRPWGSMSR